MAEQLKKTLISIALDESGSMPQARTISAFNEFLMGQQANKETQVFLSLVKFNTHTEVSILLIARSIVVWFNN